jgi:hypothetical protein
LGIMITNKRQATVTQPHVFSAAVRQCGLWVLTPRSGCTCAPAVQCSMEQEYAQWV